jgi:hypothetical protein
VIGALGAFYKYINGRYFVDFMKIRPDKFKLKISWLYAALA